MPAAPAQVLLVDTFRDAPDYFWGVLQCCKKKPKLPKSVDGGCGSEVRVGPPVPPAASRWPLISLARVETLEDISDLTTMALSSTAAGAEARASH